MKLRLHRSPPPSTLSTPHQHATTLTITITITITIAPGYDTVPKFLELYEAGLPSKLGAEGTCPSTSLCSVFYTGDCRQIRY
jgi:hypothetical protein